MLYNQQEEKLIMCYNKTQHTKQFKRDAIRYRREHPDLTQSKVAKNPGIGLSTLARWESQFRKISPSEVPKITNQTRQKKCSSET